MTLLWIVGASLCGGLLAVLLSGVVLVVRPETVRRLLPRLVSFSTGTLLAAACLGLLPHAAEALPMAEVARVVLVGLVLLFVLERLLVWRHCHRQECAVHAGSGPLLLIGDAFHNFVDGVVLAGAFATSHPLGVATALSTIAHEIPQEVAEYMVYLNHGYAPRRALLLNSATSLTTVAGGILGYFFVAEMRGAGPYLLSFAAAGFIYVALADLVPTQRGRASLPSVGIDLLLLLAGVAVVAAFAAGH